MKFKKRESLPEEIRDALGVLDELASTFDSADFQLVQAFQLVRQRIEDLILVRPDEFAKFARERGSLRPWIYTVIGNISGDLVSSGEYHVYRGELDPIGPGYGFLTLFDTSVDELVRLGAMEIDFAKQQKAGIRNQIYDVG